MGCSCCDCCGCWVSVIADCVDWEKVAKLDNLDKDFIYEFGMFFPKNSENYQRYMDVINNNYVTYEKQNAPVVYVEEDYLRKNKESVDWASVCKSQMLSEDLVREFKDYVRNHLPIHRYSPQLQHEYMEWMLE
jgi:hypothetical protein